MGRAAPLVNTFLDLIANSLHFVGMRARAPPLRTTPNDWPSIAACAAPIGAFLECCRSLRAPCAPGANPYRVGPLLASPALPSVVCCCNALRALRAFRLALVYASCASRAALRARWCAISSAWRWSVKYSPASVSNATHTPLGVYACFANMCLCVSLHS
jgi:hypothetical protein